MLFGDNILWKEIKIGIKVRHLIWSSFRASWASSWRLCCPKQPASQVLLLWPFSLCSASPAVSYSLAYSRIAMPLAVLKLSLYPFASLWNLWTKEKLTQDSAKAVWGLKFRQLSTLFHSWLLSRTILTNNLTFMSFLGFPETIPDSWRTHLFSNRKLLPGIKTMSTDLFHISTR